MFVLPESCLHDSAKNSEIYLPSRRPENRATVAHNQPGTIVGVTCQMTVASHCRGGLGFCQRVPLPWGQNPLDEK